MVRTSVDEHAALIAALVRAVRPTAIESVPLADALGRVTAVGVPSPVDLPLFRNSQMDGYAVHAADLLSLPALLPVVGDIPAGPASPTALQPGTAARIMTGAVMPEGADAVVPVEDTSYAEGVVTIGQPRVAGDYVRDRGSDIHHGRALLPAGLRLGSRHLAVLAAAGLATVDVTRRTRIAVVTTGAELVQPGEIPTLGQIFDSNGVALAAAVRAAGAVVSHLVAARDDDVDTLRATLTDVAADSDLIVTSGGISMGDYEVVRQLLEPLGAAVTTIAMQPGGPQATGSFEGVPVLCFPGNPVSSQLSFELFVAPLLREEAGLPAAVRRSYRLATATKSVPGKRQFLRGRVIDTETVELVAGASSHLVAGLAASDVLIDVPAESTFIDEGDLVETIAL